MGYTSAQFTVSVDLRTFSCVFVGSIYDPCDCNSRRSLTVRARGALGSRRGSPVGAPERQVADAAAHTLVGAAPGEVGARAGKRWS